MSETYWIFILIVVSVFVISGATGAFNSLSLQKKFVSLGDMMGMSADRIISVAGKPSSITNLGEFGLVYNWISPKYQISLSFVDGKCTGIVQENIIN